MAFFNASRIFFLFVSRAKLPCKNFYKKFYQVLDKTHNIHYNRRKKTKIQINIEAERTMISLKEIGHICGVAESTVSKALKDHSGIKLATRKRIQKVARKHNYQPNAMVQCIQTGKSKSIGIAYNCFKDSFAGAILDGIYKSLYHHGYDSLVIPWDMMVQDNANIFTRFSRRRVDGMLIFPMAQKPKPEYLEQLRMFHNPVVLIDQTWPGNEFDYAGSDNHGGAFNATAHLINCGYKKIGIMTYTAVSSGEERFAGFKAAMSSHGLPVKENFIVDIENITTSSYNHAKQLLNQKDRPEAVLCFNDNIAMALMAAASDMGIGVPDQLAVIGFGNLPSATMIRPAVTTVAQHPETIGEKAVELILERLNGNKSEPRIKIIPSELIIRSSILNKNKQESII
jgi:DNA-binding LacI/PurR family transcriptional regulator